MIVNALWRLIVLNNLVFSRVSQINKKVLRIDVFCYDSDNFLINTNYSCKYE